MSILSAKFSSRSICAAIGKIAAICYPFIVFALLAFTEVGTRRIVCAAALGAIVVFCVWKLFRRRKAQITNSHPAKQACFCSSLQSTPRPLTRGGARGTSPSPVLGEGRGEARGRDSGLSDDSSSAINQDPSRSDGHDVGADGGVGAVGNVGSIAAAAVLLIVVLATKNEDFFKLYPILVSAGFLFFFARSLLFPPCVVERVARLAYKDFTDADIPYARKVTLVWCIFFVFNIVASIISSFCSWEIWCLYNGLISYLLIGLLFAAELGVRRMYKKSKKSFIAPSMLLIEGSGDRPAFIGKNGIISFGEFRKAVTNLVEILEKRPEKSCVVQSDDAFHFAVGFFAALHSQKKVLLPQSVRAEFGTAVEKFSPLFLSDLPVEEPSSTKTDRQLQPISRDAEIVFFSSGSTGTPKVIEKTFANIEDEVVRLGAFLQRAPKRTPNILPAGGSSSSLQSNEEQKHHSAEAEGEKVKIDYREQELTVSSVKCEHIYGLLYVCLLPLCRGSVIASERAMIPPELVARAKGFESVCFVSSPAFLSRLVEEEDVLKSIGAMQVISSASALPLEVAQKIFQATGVAPLEVYGSTETGGIAWRRQTETQDCTCWDGVEISIVEGDEKEILVKTPLVNGGSVRIGDAIEITGKNTFRLLGRTDRIVKFQDNRISLDEIEKAIAKSPLVKEAYVSDCNNLNGQKVLCALVALSAEGKSFIIENGVPALSSKLKSFVKDFVEPIAVPKKWRYANEILRNGQSKIMKSEIVEMFETKLQEPLIENLTVTDDTFDAELVFLKNAAYFQGHFPTFSLLPGVAQLHFVAVYAKRFFGIDIAASSISRLKFKSPIFPGMSVHLSMKKTSSRVEFSFSKDEQVCASGRFEISNPNLAHKFPPSASADGCFVSSSLSKSGAHGGFAPDASLSRIQRGGDRDVCPTSVGNKHRGVEGGQKP